MNQITMMLQADHLIKEALKEDISSEDVTTNAVMKEAVTGEVELICKQDGIVAGLEVFERMEEKYCQILSLLRLHCILCMEE